MSAEGPIVRRALGAGRWFPGDRAELRRLVEQYLDDAQVPALPGTLVGGIAPHAGYVYSGAVAGHTFRALRDRAAAGAGPETLVILGFSHRQAFQGVALMDGEALATPLGEAPLDVEATEFLADRCAGAGRDYAPHAWEHSAENEVPFAQVAVPGARLVVALMGDREPATVACLARALDELAAERPLAVVASSDMLHDPHYELVTRTDRHTLEQVVALDADGLRRAWSPSRQVFCGLAPVLTVMAFARARGVRKGTLLAYRNSGDDFPESRGEWVVGYGAVGFAA
jgi:AmmeMemoRadiSam system protein B